MHVSDNNTQLILCSVFLAMSLRFHQNNLWGSRSTSNHLSCTHIYICTHITMIMNSVHIYVLLYQWSSTYKHTISIHVYSFHNTNIYVWLHICMRKSSQVSYCRKEEEGYVSGTLPNYTDAQPMSFWWNSSSVKYSALTSTSLTSVKYLAINI